MSRLLIAGAAVALFASATPSGAIEIMTGFMEKSHKDADGTEHNYVLFVPHDFKPGNPTPVILFLHGSGETKGGDKKPIDVGIGPAIKKREKTFPFITIVPQSVDRTWQAGSADAGRALAILDEVCANYKADPKRIYLTGLSMGGYGTWSLAAKFPEKWAAIAPVCGGGDIKAAESIKNIPCWCFHGDIYKQRRKECHAAFYPLDNGQGVPAPRPRGDTLCLPAPNGSDTLHSICITTIGGNGL